MPRTDVKLSETDIWPVNGRVWVVRSDELDSREWLRGSPVCRELQNHQTRHLAVAHMPKPFRIVRARLGGSYFLATFEGEGRVLIDGRWVHCRPGRAMLLPPNTRQAFETAPHSIWKFCWGRNQERAGQKPLASISTPVVAEFHVDPLIYHRGAVS